MKIGVLKETRAHEQRVATTPDVVKKLVQMQCEVWVEKGAGLSAFISDDAYAAAGAKLTTAKEVLGADMILKVRAPEAKELKAMQKGTVLVGMCEPFNRELTQNMAAQGLTAFALEALPRTTRAQSMDVLSSQANLAGYKAVLLGTQFYPKLMPMMMTAAGTIKAARVLVLGAGVAGLQAIATAKRLGAVVEASDVRPAVKEQIESLGAKFLNVPYETEEEAQIAAGEGGYAKPMPEAWMQRQAALVAERAKEADIIITSALIPGRTPHVLLSAETVAQMKAGAVVVDMAAGHAADGSGNCPLTQANEVVVKHGVSIVGYTNLPGLVSSDASALYAKNVLEFLKLIINQEGQLSLPQDDELVTASLLCHEGRVLKG